MATLLRILKHRVTIALLILVAAGGAMQLSAPPVIRAFALHWLAAHGATNAEIGAIHINPFSGTLVVHDLKAGEGLSIGKAGIDIDWWPLWRHQLYIRDIALEHADLKLVQDNRARWLPAGLNFPAGNTAEKGTQPWHVVLNGAKWQDVRISLSGHDLQADIPIRSLQLSHAFISQAKGQTLNAELGLGQTMISGFGYRLAEAAFQLRGQITLPGPDTAPDMVAARNTAIKIQGLSVETAAGQAVIAIKRALVHGIAMHGSGHVEAAGIEADALQFHTALAGATDTTVESLQAGPVGFDKGRLELAKLDVQNIQATDAAGQISLASIRQVSLDTLSMTDLRRGTFGHLMLRGIAMPATKAQSMGSIGSITLSAADIALPGSIQLGRLDFQGLDLTLLHEKGGMAVLDRLQAILPPSPPGRTPSPSTTASAPAPVPTGIRLGLVTIDKGSKIAFTDTAVYPPFQSSLEVESFRLSSLDLSGKQPGSVDAAFKLGDQGRLMIKGDLQPSRTNPAAKLDITVKRLSMPMLSGYVARDFGNAIKTGQMDLDGQWYIQNHAIDAKNRLVIRNLELTSSSQTGRASQSIGMPLDMAVNMLRDNRGDISLQVPVNGRLDDPNVNINDAIDQALASAIKSGAMSYASLLLQPYGSILPAISLASDIIGYASKPRLTPIAFAPRTAALSPEAKAYIGKIAILLKQKGFRLQACGVASPAEMQDERRQQPKQESGTKAENDRLLSLATARSAAVIKALVGEGISPDRVFTCLSKIDTQPHAGGRVELLLK